VFVVLHHFHSRTIATSRRWCRHPCLDCPPLHSTVAKLTRSRHFVQRSGAGTQALPFRTVQRAQKAARDLTKNMDGDVVVPSGPGRLPNGPPAGDGRGWRWIRFPYIHIIRSQGQRCQQQAVRSVKVVTVILFLGKILPTQFLDDVRYLKIACRNGVRALVVDHGHADPVDSASRKWSAAACFTCIFTVSV